MSSYAKIGITEVTRLANVKIDEIISFRQRVQRAEISDAVVRRHRLKRWFPWLKALTAQEGHKKLSTFALNSYSTELRVLLALRGLAEGPTTGGVFITLEDMTLLQRTFV